MPEPPTLPKDTLRRLREWAEPAYRDFAAALIPGMDKARMLGVRLPKLRGLARRLAKGGLLKCRARRGETFEETMLRGFLPGYADHAPLAARLEALAAFVPSITNWSLCDSCCATCKFAQQHREDVWDWLQPYLQSAEEYPARFGIVMLLNHYAKSPAWAPRVAAALPCIPATGFYAAMAAAWCTCELHILHPQTAAPLLRPGTLRADILSLALRKIKESRRRPASSVRNADGR